MLLEILQQPNPLLREKSHRVDKITPEIINLAQNMLETMYQNKGVGLAAPQVGQPIQMIVFDPSPDHDMPGILINPTIVSHSKDTIENVEGCLSCRGFEGLVKRWDKVTVQGINLEGKKITIKASGLLSRILQHEIDHLNGILITDIAKPIPPELTEKEPEVV